MIGHTVQVARIVGILLLAKLNEGCVHLWLLCMLHVCTIPIVYRLSDWPWMCWAQTSTKHTSDFTTSKTHNLSEKHRWRHLNTKVCGSARSAIFVLIFLFNNDNSRTVYSLSFTHEMNARQTPRLITWTEVITRVGTACAHGVYLHSFVVVQWLEPQQ